MTASKPDVCCVHSVMSVSDTKTPTGTKQTTVYSFFQPQFALSQPKSGVYLPAAPAAVSAVTYQSSYSCMQALCKMSLA